jgi:ABC-type lipoprotein release transport system permease subunit
MTGSLERHRSILDFALSSLLRRKGKNLSLWAVYTMVVFLISAIVFYTHALKREASVILQGAPDIVVQKMVAGRQDLVPVRYAEEIAAMRGVSAVRPRLWGYYYDPVTRANYTLMAADKGFDEPGSVDLGAGVARSMRVVAGDLIPLRDAEGVVSLHPVRNVFPHASELAASDLILLSEDDLRTLFRFPPGMATDLALTVGNPNELGTIAAKIARQFPDSRPILKSEILRTYDSIFDWRGGMMVVMLGVAVLSFVIFAWDKATGLSAEERKEVGILKSIGWETGDVLLLKFWEGAVISLSAFLCGVILAYCQVFLFSASLFEPALKGWSVLYPRFRLVPDVDPYQVFVLFFLTVVPYTVATVIPSWRAATVDPDAAMRS